MAELCKFPYIQVALPIIPILMPILIPFLIQILIAILARIPIIYAYKQLPNTHTNVYLKSQLKSI